MKDWSIVRFDGECVPECGAMESTCTHDIDIRSDETERHVATIHSPIWENDVANARLIVAAPDLLDALYDVHGVIRKTIGILDEVSPTLSDALFEFDVARRAAITKAEGKA